MQHWHEWGPRFNSQECKENEVCEWVSEYTYINKEEGEKKFKESLKKKKQSKKLEVYYIAKKKQNSPPQMIVFSYNIRNQLI